MSVHKIICAWCGRFLGGDPNATEISHGICADCKKAQLAKIGKVG